MFCLWTLRNFVNFYPKNGTVIVNLWFNPVIKRNTVNVSKADISEIRFAVTFTMNGSESCSINDFCRLLCLLDNLFVHLLLSRLLCEFCGKSILLATSLCFHSLNDWKMSWAVKRQFKGFWCTHFEEAPNELSQFFCHNYQENKYKLHNLYYFSVK